MTDRIVVVGSINADIIATVPERAAAGKTVLVSGVERRCGGKGANQAAAAARAGAETVLIAAVGDDHDGEAQLAELVRDGVDVSAVLTLPGVPTGFAFITVTPDGENSITVAPGANAELTAEHALAALESAAPALVALQTEVSAEVVDVVGGWCAARGVRLVLNDGPVVPLSRATLAAAHPLVVNEHEAREICAAGREVAVDDLAAAVSDATGAQSVVVTLGDVGSQIAEGDRVRRVPAARAAVIRDTTGAGDTFLGTLAAGLAAGEDLVGAVRLASAAAAESVSWIGARPPARDDLSVSTASPAAAR